MVKQLSVTVSCPIAESFRVAQTRGIFDLQQAKTDQQTFDVELPDLSADDWQIGVIVGPSGSGKSTIAREAFDKSLFTSSRWPKDAAVVDAFPAALDIKQITSTLTAVGFSSPPAWLRPYHVLSGGERFRCDLARALLSGQSLVAFDEFTSVVDRTVAKIGSAAVAKAIRKRRVPVAKFVAVTCHYDVLDWLEPDWVLDMASRRLARGQLRRHGLWKRPPIELTLTPIHRTAWQLFRRHHYLNTSLLVNAKCFCAFWGNEPVAFSAWINKTTRNCRPGDMREHRTVVLPDFQGAGIGNRVSELCASIFVGNGRRAFSTTSHPSMIRYRSESPHWRRSRLSMANPQANRGNLNNCPTKISCDRITGGFHYVGPAMDRELAQRMLAARPVPWLVSDSAKAALRVLAAHRGATSQLVAALCHLPADQARRACEELAAAELATATGRGRYRTYTPAA